MGSSASHAACARSRARKRGPPPPRGFPRRASRKRARDASSPFARRYREHQRSPSRSARARRVSGPRFLAERATDSRSSPVPTPEGLTAWGSAGSGPWMPVSGIHCADLRQKNVLGEAKGGLMKTHRPITSGIALLFLVALIAGSSGGHAAAASTTTFSGQATAVRGSIAAVPLLNTLLPCTPQSPKDFCIVDTGPLTATQAVQGRADFRTANAGAKCTNGTASVSGSAEVARVNSQPVLTIGPYTIVVAETPNYDVLAYAPPAVRALLPPGTQIIINKQASGDNGSGGRQIDVTALYINVPTVVELFIADVHADITCAALAQCPGPHAFVTSGGFVDPTGSNKQHFAAAGRNLTNWGHVIYRDTATGYTIHVKDPYGAVYSSFDDLKMNADAQGFDTSRLDAMKFQG